MKKLSQANITCWELLFWLVEAAGHLQICTFSKFKVPRDFHLQETFSCSYYTLAYTLSFSVLKSGKEQKIVKYKMGTLKM